MRHPDNKPTTASAPETRTGFDYWHPKSKAFDPDPDKRTIPAEKPTAQDDDGKISRSDWRELAISRYADVERYRTHAAQLAEALREAIIRMDHLLDDASGEHSPTYENAKQVLDAYESEVRQ